MAGLLLLIFFGDPAIEGNILLRQGRCPDALPLLRTATQNNSNYALAWYDLAYCYRKIGQHREAIAAYRQYATLRPGSPDPYFGIGVALRALGDVDGARKAFETYIALEQRPSEQRWVDKARQELAELSPKPIAAPKPVVAATPAFTPKPLPEPPPSKSQPMVASPPVVAVAAPAPKPVPIVTPPPPPKSAEPSTDVARAAIAEHRWPDAEAELDRLIAAHPDDRAAFLLRSEVRRELGNPRGAADDATSVLRLRPGDPTAVRLLGEALMAAGDREHGRYYLELYRYLVQRSGN